MNPFNPDRLTIVRVLSSCNNRNVRSHAEPIIDM
jgi:hypothetical protein